MDYTRLSSRWRLPATYYQHTELLPDGGTADLFHLDTTSINNHRDDQQLIWFERALASSIATWKIVIGHHPVRSGGQHGDTEALKILLEPLLEHFGVHVYLNGHDHDLQHITVGRTHFLTCGAAAEARPAKAVEGTKFVMGGRLGFMTARLAPAAMDIAFIDQQGNSLYRTSIQSLPSETQLLGPRKRDKAA